MAAYQACLLASIALTSPTFVAMGTMLAIPGSIAYDFVLKGYLEERGRLRRYLPHPRRLRRAELRQSDRRRSARHRPPQALRSCEPNRPPPADGKTANGRGMALL